MSREGGGEEERRLATTENSCLNGGMLMAFRLCFCVQRNFWLKN